MYVLYWRTLKHFTYLVKFWSYDKCLFFLWSLSRLIDVFILNLCLYYDKLWLWEGVHIVTQITAYAHGVLRCSQQLLWCFLKTIFCRMLQTDASFRHYWSCFSFVYIWVLKPCICLFLYSDRWQMVHRWRTKWTYLYQYTWDLWIRKMLLWRYKGQQLDNT